MQIVKIVIVGDSQIGKTCLATTYMTNTFPTWTPKVCSLNGSCSVFVDGRAYNVDIRDTDSDPSEEGTQGRLLDYQMVDAFLLCYELGRSETLRSLETRWVPEITRWQEDSGRRPALMLLCGLKGDLSACPLEGARRAKRCACIANPSVLGTHMTTVCPLPITIATMVASYLQLAHANTCDKRFLVHDGPEAQAVAERVGASRVLCEAGALRKSCKAPFVEVLRAIGSNLGSNRPKPGPCAVQ